MVVKIIKSSILFIL